MISTVLASPGKTYRSSMYSWPVLAASGCRGDGTCGHSFRRVGRAPNSAGLRNPPPKGGFRSSLCHAVWHCSCQPGVYSRGSPPEKTRVCLISKTCIRLGTWA